MLNAIAKMLGIITNSKPKMIVDLSNASDDGLALVLMRVSGVDLLKSCTQKSFWIDKAELEGYKLEWPRLAALSIRTYQAVAMRKPFGRNFIRDSWNLQKPDGSCWQRDKRWKLDIDHFLHHRQPSQLQRNPPHSRGGNVCIEVPPVFMDGQAKASAETGELPEACLATSYTNFSKRIIIRLEDEGLTDQMMDEFRPTLVVSELVANRRDCGCKYRMRCQLFGTDEDELNFDFNQDETDTVQHVQVRKEFAQWEAEAWHRIECVFKDYPPTMRFLMIECSGRDSQSWAGNYGVKMAQCRVEALCESNRNNDEENRGN